MHYIDSHAHLSSEKFANDREETIQRAKSAGISWILNVADTIETSTESLCLADKYDFIVSSVGIHPHNAQTVKENNYKTLKNLLKKRKVVAIGEIGLDYYYDFCPKDIQKKVFTEQIRIAKEFHLPVIIHNRDAEEDILEILEKEHSDSLCGVFHCFSGNEILAQRIIKLGFYISFSGILTFPNAENLRKTAAKIPLNMVLTETDAPYLAPQKFRGKRNEPGYVVEILETLALIQNKTNDYVAEQVEKNFSNLFLRKLM